MPKTNFIAFGVLLVAALMLVACENGELPTAVPRLVELKADYVTHRPTVDGRANEAFWKTAQPYLVHVEGDGAGDEDFNITFKAVWWLEWVVDQEAPYVAIQVTWPDDDKNLDKDAWVYNPVDSSWSVTDKDSDWLLMAWISAGMSMDLWYWDAALCNPMGYAEDLTLDFFDVGDGEAGEDPTQMAVLSIDGLNLFNDTPTERNNWDRNYFDNGTPRDSTDDRPSMAWTFDVDTLAPGLPRIYSSAEEAGHFLLAREADYLEDTPYAKPASAATIPGYILEDPMDSAADVMAAGVWKDGAWTVEFVRSGTTRDSKDVAFNPKDPLTSASFVVGLGDNKRSFLDAGLNQEEPINTANSVVLTFETLILP